ncbi:hypothetical protein HDV05_003002 [Chytridiales sp. JEL 0842]|nr:hypothetical protein HDV05_003002 [Chytridiales sp. JEL 0842]
MVFIMPFSPVYAVQLFKAIESVANVVSASVKRVSKDGKIASKDSNEGSMVATQQSSDSTVGDSKSFGARRIASSWWKTIKRFGRQTKPDMMYGALPVDVGKELPKRFLKEYHFGRKIGEGAFGWVGEAMRIKDGKRVAVKVMRKDTIRWCDWVVDLRSPTKPLVTKEIKCMRTVNHKGIVGYISHQNTRNYLVLVMEKHGVLWNPITDSFSKIFEKVDEDEDGDVYGQLTASYYAGLPIETVQKIFAQVALGVNYLHKMSIVHRDIKPENILIDNDYVTKIIDLGMASRSGRNQRLPDSGGTQHYMSPEALGKLNQYLGQPADVWSLGVLLFELLYDELPFTDYWYIRHVDYDFPDYATEATFDGPNDIIRRIFVLDVEQRATLDEILSHPWLANTVAELKLQGF